MKASPYFLFPLLLVTAMACHREQGEQESHRMPQDRLRWLAGTWSRPASDSTVHGEVWIRQSDSLYAGYGFRERNGYRTITESLTLTARKEAGYYSARVRNQNDNRVVRFRITTLEADGFTCENPAHDFPTRIEYRHRGEWPHDSLVALVSGPGEGNIEREITFAFGRRSR
jgi:hypothetical protein